MSMVIFFLFGVSVEEFTNPNPFSKASDFIHLPCTTKEKEVTLKLLKACEVPRVAVSMF